MPKRSGKYDIGRRFGRLVIVGIPESDKRKRICRCDCGHFVTVLKHNLGRTVSCGCRRSEAASDTGRRLIAENTAQSRDANARYDTNFNVIATETPPRNNHSGKKGVWYDEKHGVWLAYISVHRRRHHLGTFRSFADAALARDNAEQRYFSPLIQAWNAERGGADHASARRRAVGL